MKRGIGTVAVVFIALLARSDSIFDGKGLTLDGWDIYRWILMPRFSIG